MNEKVWRSGEKERKKVGKKRLHVMFSFSFFSSCSSCPSFCRKQKEEGRKMASTKKGG
jgi:hypothetical protein